MIAPPPSSAGIGDDALEGGLGPSGFIFVVDTSLPFKVRPTTAETPRTRRG